MKALACSLLIAATALPVFASDRGAEDNKLKRAEAVLAAALESPDKGIPKEMLEHAECVGVFPDVKKAAFIVGGKGGTGVFSCRDEKGLMGPPVFFKVAGGSVGWQFGGQETDLVLLVMNRNGIEHLLKDKFTLGGEAAATAGPVGRTAQAATDAQLHAQILSWSRSQGAFLGAALEGTVVRPDDNANRAFYGKAVSAKSVLVDHAVTAPKDSNSFVRLLNEHTNRG